MRFSQQIVIKRWKSILEGYRKIQDKTTPHSLCLG
jgi:hypothetical protein